MVGNYVRNEAKGNEFVTTLRRDDSSILHSNRDSEQDKGRESCTLQAGGGVEFREIGAEGLGCVKGLSIRPDRRN